MAMRCQGIPLLACEALDSLESFFCCEADEPAEALDVDSVDDADDVDGVEALVVDCDASDDGSGLSELALSTGAGLAEAASDDGGVLWLEEDVLDCTAELLAEAGAALADELDVSSGASDCVLACESLDCDVGVDAAVEVSVAGAGSLAEETSLVVSVGSVDAEDCEELLGFSGALGVVGSPGVGAPGSYGVLGDSGTFGVGTLGFSGVLGFVGSLGVGAPGSSGVLGVVGSLGLFGSVG